MCIFRASSVYSGRGFRRISTGFSLPESGDFCGVDAGGRGTLAAAANPAATTVPRFVPPWDPPVAESNPLAAATPPVFPGRPGSRDPLKASPKPDAAVAPTRPVRLPSRLLVTSPKPEASVLRCGTTGNVGAATFEKTFVTTGGGGSAKTGAAFGSITVGVGTTRGAEAKGCGTASIHFGVGVGAGIGVGISATSFGSGSIGFGAVSFGGGESLIGFGCS